MARDDAAIVQLQVRLREDLRRSLEEAAKANGRSLNGEIIGRLEHTRDRQGLLPEVLELAFGRRMAGVLLALGYTMSLAATIAGRDPTRRDDWSEEYYAWRSATEAAGILLQLWQPQEIAAAPDVAGREPNEIGLQAVAAVMELMSERLKMQGQDMGRGWSLDLLGPMPAAMVNRFPAEKELRQKVAPVEKKRGRR
jgi:hypothetical protein